MYYVVIKPCDYTYANILAIYTDENKVKNHVERYRDSNGHTNYVYYTSIEME